MGRKPVDRFLQSHVCYLHEQLGFTASQIAAMTALSLTTVGRLLRLSVTANPQPLDVEGELFHAFNGLNVAIEIAEQSDKPCPTQLSKLYAEKARLLIKLRAQRVAELEIEPEWKQRGFTNHLEMVYAERDDPRFARSITTSISSYFPKP